MDWTLIDTVGDDHPVYNDFPFSGVPVLFVLNGIHPSPSESSQWAKIDGGQFPLAVRFVSRILAWMVSDQRRFPTLGVVGTMTSAGTQDDRG